MQRIFQPMHQLRLLGSLVPLALLLLVSRLSGASIYNILGFSPKVDLPPHGSFTIARCRQLNMQAGPSDDFWSRSASDRFEPETKPILIQDGKIWTGGKNGTEIIYGDVLLENGLIKSISRFSVESLQAYGSDLVVTDAKGSWITPGIVDVHSHLGDFSSPALSGAEDDNSGKGTIQPWLRSLDGLNTHDESYRLSIAGGVTTSLILPGSANAIGMILDIRS